MKITAAIIAFATTASQPCADDLPFVKELEQLQKQRDKDIAAAIEPINRRYQASLEQLSRKATQANALDAALKIRQASEQISNRFPQAAGTEIVGVWVITTLGNGWAKDMEFKADGTLVASWGGLGGTWEMTDKELKFTFTEGKETVQTNVFKLPIKDGQLFGIDNGRTKKSLTKKSK